MLSADSAPIAPTDAAPGRAVRWPWLIAALFILGASLFLWGTIALIFVWVPR